MIYWIDVVDIYSILSGEYSPWSEKCIQSNFELFLMYKSFVKTLTS